MAGFVTRIADASLRDVPAEDYLREARGAVQPRTCR
jgi:hypothetical protein